MYGTSCTTSIPVGVPTATFDCFVYHGQSGSPIWTYANDGTDQRYIRGIATSQQDTTQASVGGYTIITESVFKDIQSYVASYTGGSRKKL